MTDTADERVTAYIQRCLDDSTPLTAEQIAKLSALFNYPITE